MHPNQEDRHRSSIIQWNNDEFYHRNDVPLDQNCANYHLPACDAFGPYQYQPISRYVSHNCGPDTSYQIRHGNGSQYFQRGDNRFNSGNRSDVTGHDGRTFDRPDGQGRSEENEHQGYDYHYVQSLPDNGVQSGAAFDNEYCKRRRIEVDARNSTEINSREDFQSEHNSNARKSEIFKRLGGYVSDSARSSNEDQVATAPQPVPLLSINLEGFQARQPRDSFENNHTRQNYRRLPHNNGHPIHKPDHNKSEKNFRVDIEDDDRQRKLEKADAKAKTATSNLARESTCSATSDSQSVVSSNQARLSEEVPTTSPRSSTLQINRQKNLSATPRIISVERISSNLQMTCHADNKVKDKTTIHHSVSNATQSTSGSSDQNQVSTQVATKNCSVQLKRLNQSEISCTAEKRLKQIPTTQNKVTEIRSTNAKTDNNNDFTFTRNRFKQIKFLFYLRNKTYKDMKFSLVSEVKNSAKLSDKLFRFENISHCIICEAKCINVKDDLQANKNILLNYRTMSSSEFDIKKYFHVFLAHKQESSNKQLKNLIIFCNFGLSVSVFYKNKIRITNDDENLKKLEVLNAFEDGEEHEWYKKFLECCTLPNLAKEIIHAMDKKKVHFNTKVMKKYIKALEKERIIKIEIQKKNGKDVHLAKFNEDFICNRNLSRPARQLRCYVLKSLRNRKLMLEMYFAIPNSSEISSEVSMNLPDEDSELLFEEFFQIFRFGHIDNNFHEYDKFLSKQFAEAESIQFLADIQEEILKSIQLDKSLDETTRSLEKLISKCKVEKKTLNEVTKVKVELKNETLVALKNKLGNGDRRIIHLYLTDSISLTTLAIKQISESMFLYVENKEALFITDKILLEMTDNIIDVLTLDSTKLLAIQWNTNTYDEISKLAFAKIQNILDNLSDEIKKSIIVIAKTDNVISELSSVKIVDDENSFLLTRESQNDILQKTRITLQERQYRLLDLMDENVAETFIREPQVIEALVYEKMTFANEFSKPSWLNRSHFDAQLKQHVVIDKKIFQENIDEVFCLRNIESRQLKEFIHSDQEVYDSNRFPLNAKFILLDPHIDNFSMIFERFREKSVHIINYADNQFVWQISNGNITNLLKYKIDDVDPPRNSNFIDDIITTGPKTVIVSGESGIGKSTYLYNLAQRTYTTCNSKVDTPVWVIYVNIENLNINALPTTNDEAIGILTTHLQLENEQRKLFVMSANGELKLKIMLFVDGCDDLPFEELKTPIKLLQKLQETNIQKIIVTSRCDTTLEAELNTFSYQLQFSYEQKIQFLHNYWRLASDMTEKAKNFIKKYAEFTSTPLYLKLLVEINEGRDELLPINNYHDLYQNYVQLKVSDEDIRTVEELLMQKIIRDKVTIQLDENSSISELPKDLSHISFAEYSIARRVSSNSVLSNQQTCNIFISLIDNTFIDGVSRVFLGTLLPLFKANNYIETFVNKLAQDGYLQFLKTILKFEKDARPCLHNLIRSSNRVNCQNFKNKTLETLAFVLKNYNDTGDNEIMKHGELKAEYEESSIVSYVNSRKENSTPLQLAALQRREDLACELLLYGANISHLGDEYANFVRKMANYVVAKLVTDDCRFHSIVEKLLMSIPQQDAIELCKHNYPKIIDYFFTHGRIEIIERLLPGPDDRSDYLAKCINVESPLDLVNKSHHLNDEGRWKMIRYINNNFGENFVKDNIDQVLRSACQFKHWRAFVYAVGDHQMEFLKNVLLNNEHEILDFLRSRGKTFLTDKDGNTAMHCAVSLNVSPWTLSKTSEICGIDDQNVDGRTVLHLAFIEGVDLSRIKLLIDKKNASLSQKDRHGLYPWSYILIDEFCRYDKRETLKIMDYLLLKGIQAPDYAESNLISEAYVKQVRQKLKYYMNLKKINSDDIKEDIPPLCTAMKDSTKEKWCKFLIKQEMDINTMTNLHIALYNKRYQIVKLILERGAIIDAEDNNGLTPLQILTSNPDTTEDYKEVKQLLELAEKLFVDKKALRKNFEVSRTKFDTLPIKYLINCRNKKRQNLYHIAASFGSASTIENLTRLDKHCRDNYVDYQILDINDQDEFGNTALHIAAEKGNERVIEHLLRSGACYEINNFEGHLPIDLASNKSIFEKADELFVAVENQDVDKVDKILANNKEYLVNARDEFGRCCLHHASDEATMKVLIRKFVKLYNFNNFNDIDAMDFDLRTPLYFAAEENHLNCAKLLLRAGASYKLENLKIDVNPTVQLLRDIDKLFEDVNSDDPKYFTNDKAWQLADYLKDKCQCVIVNARDDQKNTLMHYAAKYNFDKAVEILLKNGATYNAENRKKETPKFLATSVKIMLESLDKMFENMEISTWKELKLNTQVIVNCRMQGGYTLLHKAVESGKLEETKWLLDNYANIEATDDLGFRVECDRQKYPEIDALLQNYRLA